MNARRGDQVGQEGETWGHRTGWGVPSVVTSLQLRGATREPSGGPSGRGRGVAFLPWWDHLVHCLSAGSPGATCPPGVIMHDAKLHTGACVPQSAPTPLPRPPCPESSSSAPSSKDLGHCTRICLLLTSYRYHPIQNSF